MLFFTWYFVDIFVILLTLGSKFIHCWLCENACGPLKVFLLHFARCRALSVEGAGDALREDGRAFPTLGADWPGFWEVDFFVHCFAQRAFPRLIACRVQRSFPFVSPTPFDLACGGAAWSRARVRASRGHCSPPHLLGQRLRTETLPPPPPTPPPQVAR